MRGNNGTHTRLEKLVNDELRDRGWHILGNDIEYRNRFRVIGDLDVLAYKQVGKNMNYMLVECKTNPHLKKATEQLRRADKKYFDNDMRHFMFHAYFIDKNNINIDRVLMPKYHKVPRKYD